MKSQNRRRRCTCCCDTPRPRPPPSTSATTAKDNHPSSYSAELSVLSDSLQCYDVSQTLVDTTAPSRIRTRRNQNMPKPLLHAMLLIMITWTATTTTTRLPQYCDAFTLLLKHTNHRTKERATFARLPATVPSLPSENSKVVRGGSQRKRTIPRRPDEAMITLTSSSSSIKAITTESLTEKEMKQSMLSTLKRDKRKKLLSRHDYQLEVSMLNHALLTKEEEYELTHLHHTAKELQRQINEILLQKQQQQKLDLVNTNDRENLMLNELGMNDYDDNDDDDDETDHFDEQLYTNARRANGTKKKETLSTHSYTDYMEYQQWQPENDDDDHSWTRASSTPSVRWKSQLLERLDQSSRTTMASLLLDTPMVGITSVAEDNKNDGNMRSYDARTNDDDGYYDAFMAAEFNLDTESTANPHWNDSDQLSSSSTLSRNHLTERDIVEFLNLPGGRKEMERILLIGAQARDTLIRSNLKLVSSICKKWVRNSQGGTRSDARRPETYFSIYSGGWDRPSLSEAIQEGVIGLTTAVERFDPSRGLRFSTYATYWITNSVRQCFQRASTGCLRLPTNYYDTRTRFKTLVRKYYEMDGVVPSMDVLAREMGLSEQRLQWILRITQGLLSMEGLLVPLGANARAGKSGSINRMEDSLLLADTIADNTNNDGTEFGSNPMDCVELSFLRQQLERAMAVELVPFERDVLRLRLGLDDGVVRNCREVALICGGRLKQSDIRTVERRALKKLRSPLSLATYKLLTFLDFADVDIKTITLT